MISARQELDLRPQLERLDALLLRSAGVDPGAVSFKFRPLWQLDASAKAAVALTKAQTTQVYAGLGLWPATTTAALVQAQLAEDGTYPNAEGVFTAARPIQDAGFDPDQPRSERGEWTSAGGEGGARAIDPSQYKAIFHEHERRVRRARAAAKHRELAEHKRAEAEAGKRRAEEAAKSKAKELNPHSSTTEHAGEQRPATVGHSPIETPRSQASLSARARIPDGSYGSIAKVDDMIIQVTGDNPTAQGKSYEQGLRNTFGSQGESHIRVEGIGYVDDIVDEGQTAFEAKYTDNFARSPYNPVYEAGYPHTEVEDTVDELEKRANYFERGVIIFTNSEDLATTYDRLLAARHVTKYRFVLTDVAK